MLSESNSNKSKKGYSILINGIFFLMFGIFWLIKSSLTTTFLITFYIFAIALSIIIGMYCLLLYFTNRDIFYETYADKKTTLLLGMIVGILIIIAIIIDIGSFIRFNSV